ncbi:MAG TPA: FAD-dependent oxidoreductase, partial [Mycobacterium sp.]|nr:FAD-dependent oxidoreductase [Mycobacterium sp.]
MSAGTTFVIVGGGLAGAKAAEALRDRNFDGTIVLIAEEEQLPYERPPLSKEFLAGKKTLTDFTVDSADWYREHNVDLRLGTRAVSLDPSARTVGLAGGGSVGYHKLLLATGSRSRHVPIPGADADRVHYLRTFDDASALNSQLSEGSSLAVVGAGWIGLEVAASARQRGVNVTVVETAKLPLLAAL